MRWILQGLALLAACIAGGAVAQTLAVKTLELGHPANGGIAKIGNQLAVSGHSVQDRWLSLIDLDDFSHRSIDIPTQAQFFSSMVLAGHESEQLIFLTAEGVTAFDGDATRRLVETSSIHPVADTKRLGYRELVIDINDSGLSDLLIPDFTAHHLYIQQPEGGFEHFPLAVDTEVRLWEKNPRYIARQPYRLDMNLDGRTDIAFVRDDTLLVFAQRDDGSFPERPATVELAMPISSDNEADIRSGDGRDFEGLVVHRLHDMLDLDGDGHMDLIVREEAYESSVDQNYAYRIYYGRPGEQSLGFPAETDARIETSGIQFEPVFTDLDGDGRKDFYTISAEFGVGNIVRALIRGSAKVEIEFYLLRESREFPREPDYAQAASANVSIGAGRFDLPLVTVADFEGDGRKSLLVGEGGDELRVHQAATDDLFASRAKGFASPLPKDGSRVKVLDLNGDGKEDLVLPFDSQDQEEARNQVRLIFVK